MREREPTLWEGTLPWRVMVPVVMGGHSYVAVLCGPGSHGTGLLGRAGSTSVTSVGTEDEPSTGIGLIPM